MIGITTQTNGNLVTDNDAGLCPNKAVSQYCTSARKGKRNAVPVSPRASGQEARAPMSDGMETRSKLKKRN